jgi:hypothetical protein
MMVKLSTKAVIGLAVVLLGLSSALALAAYPRPKSYLIAPGESFGGVSIGESLSKVKTAWGRPNACASDGCDYEGSDKKYSPNEVADVSVQHGNVTDVRIGAFDVDSSLPRGPYAQLLKFKTSKGIGLGSTIAAARRAYPGLRVTHRGTDTFFTLGTGRAKTFFNASSRRTTIDYIQMGDLPPSV